MLRAFYENSLYLLISLLLNLVMIKILYLYLFSVSPPVREFYPILKVQIQEIKPKAPQPQKPVKKEKPKVSRKTPEVGKKESTKAVAVTQPHERGDIPVKKEEKEEEVSILSELEKKILKRVKERQKARKEVGEISAVVKEKSVEIKVGSRKLVSIPKAPVFKVKEFPSSVRVRIWVSPDGRVIRAVIVQRSGIAEIDNELLKFVRKLRFEKIEVDEVQVGTVVFRFATS